MSYRAKLFATAVLFGIMLAGGFAWVAHWAMRRADIGEAGAYLETTAIMTAAGLDTKDVAALTAAEDPRAHPRYAAVREQLLGVPEHVVTELDRDGDRASEALVDTYLLVRTDRAGRMRLLVGRDESRTGSVVAIPRVEEGWTASFAQTKPWRAHDGDRLSAFAPVRDDTGRTIAVVGLDVGHTYFQVVLQSVAAAAATLFVLIVILVFVASWWYARRMAQPIDRLSAGMEAVGRGELETQVEQRRRDDQLEKLIARFNEMVEALRERRTMKASLAAASEIQARLLPSAPPVVEGYDITGGIRYCDETGGDYYDFIDLGSPLWALLIGDVTGHGVPAALLMASNRAVLRAEAVPRQRDVSGLCRAVNRNLVRDAHETTFMTLFYGVLDIERHRLVWASAGHVPVLHFRDGACSWLDATDVPLGVFESRTFPEGDELVLAPGDILVLVTDGVTEARDPDRRLFGSERLEEVVRAHAASSAHAIGTAVLDAVAEHRGSMAQDDDVTLVVLKRR